MPRIIGVDIPANKRIEYAIQYLYGIGPTLAKEILKKAKFESEQKLLDNISDNESVVKAATERAKKDANDMKSQFQKTLDHFKAKNTELRSLVSNLSDNLKDVEQRNKELTQANQKLTQEREAWQSKYATVQQEQKNERQLMEAKLKAVQLSESSQRETELGDAFALFEREKKSIHTFVANAFPRLFDPRKPMTDESFRSLIKSISAELHRRIDLFEVVFLIHARQRQGNKNGSSRDSGCCPRQKMLYHINIAFSFFIIRMHIHLYSTLHYHAKI